MDRTADDRPLEGLDQVVVGVRVVRRRLAPALRTAGHLVVEAEVGIILYTGGDAYTVQRRRCLLTGRRCFSGAYGPKSRFLPEMVDKICGLLDSGAFSDSPEDRLTPDAALDRQMAWEANASRLWGQPYVSEAIVSYDLLIDEKWTGDKKKKERWSVADAEGAVQTTIEAAAYPASQRSRLSPRRLVLACQGVDAIQYRECVQGVLPHAMFEDWIGLGGWCILGRQKSWLGTFWASMRACLPLIAAAGVRRIHIFGVMYRPALGGLLWLADQSGLAVSTDSSKPILGPCWADQKKAGVLAPTWEENTRLWQEALVQLRQSPHYREPPLGRTERQLSLW